MSPQRLEFSINQTSSAPSEAGEIAHFGLILNVPGWTGTPVARRIDRDSLPACFAALTPALTVDLELAGSRHTATLEFNEPEDLEPDAIAGQLGVVQRLQALRRRLRSHDDADAAVAELREFVGTSNSGEQQQPAAAGPEQAQPSDAGDSFSALLGGGRSTGRSQSSFVARLLEGDASAASVADHSELIELCDDLVNALVKQVLVHPGFQAIERSWQGVTWLTSELDLDEQAGLWLLPIDLDALLSAGSSTNSTAEFEAGFAALQSALQKTVAGIDGGALKAIGVDGSFETPESIGVLAGLAELARSLSCILLSKAPAGLTKANSTLELDAGYPPHDETLQQVWQTFREQPAARHCAAVLPRLMRRLPYGANGEATYLPGFEELEPAPEHRQFPWINPVYGLIYLMAREEVAEDLIITDLPMPVFDDGSGSSIMPCAEAYLSEADTADLQANGIMVFQSYRNRNAVKLSGLFTLS